MNKKVMMMGTILVTVSLLAILAFAGNKTENGYELFKDVLGNFESHDIESGLFEGSLVLTDNDEIKLAVSGTFAQEKEDKMMSGIAQIESPKMNKAIEVYGDDQMIYIVDADRNDVYISKVKEEKANKEWEYEHMGEFDETDEAIVDYFIGNFKKNFKTLEDTDGSTDILFELNKSEIPAIVNLLASSKYDEQYVDEEDEFSNHQEYAKYPLFNDLMALENIELSIDSNVEVQYVRLVMDLNGNQKVQGMEFTLELTGDDELGEHHKVKFEGFFTANDVGEVEVRTINMDGLTVYELPEEDK